MQQTQARPHSVRETLQKSRELAYNISDPQHPARELISKLLGEHRLTAIVEEDIQTLASMKHVNGLVAFVVTLTNKANMVISQGRGTAIINPTNSYMGRNIYSAFNNAMVDAVVRATKVLNLLVEDSVGKTTVSVPITQRQQDYLRELFRIPFNSAKRERYESRLETLTKDEASDLIGSLMK